MDKQEYDKIPLALQNRIVDTYKKASGEDDDASKQIVQNLECVFGKDNLNFMPRDWAEFVAKGKNGTMSVELFNDGTSKVSGTSHASMRVRCAALLKIVQLIEICYGGMVSANEWYYCNGIYIICPCFACDDLGESYAYLRARKAESISDYTPLAFHTKELAEQFLAYNWDLTREYFNLVWQYTL